MDFIGKSATQLTDLFKSMTPGARITTALLLVVVVVAIGYLFQQQNAGPDAYLMGGEAFPAAQLPSIEAAFHKAGLSNYQLDGNRIKVPRNTQHAYMGAMADEQVLPANFGTYLNKAVGSASPWLGKAQQQEKIKVAKQDELQLIIRSMKGGTEIESAAVLYDVQENRGFGQKNTMTASVSVKPVGSKPLEVDRVRALRHLVASSIAGLNPQDVTVIDLNGGAYPGGVGPSGGTAGSLEDNYGSNKRMYEKDWELKVRSALVHIPGVLVTAEVELDPETSHQETSSEFDAKAVVSDQRETTGEKTTESGAPGGQPGLAAQANTGAKLTPTAVSKNSDVTSHNETHFAVPHKQKQITTHGLTPKNVQIAVGIPSNYYEKVWHERNPTPAGQPEPKPPVNALTDIANEVKIDVEKTVVHLLPPKESTVDKFPPVHVATFQSLLTTPPEAPGLKDNALAWLGQYWGTLGMGGLALVSLVILRSMVRSAPAAEEPTLDVAGETPATIPMTAAGEPEKKDTNARSRLKRRGPGGPSLRDELADIVKEDPDVAVSILRTWIGNAS